ncbi:hypothetical protein M7I_6691 [Glarea lozoyensis 74030]|uniref:Uncharacterized protein n=1 Tax=Glarea lozoyensis (strain ATCC 74030 / MF5533) TaxID=1104152 RepID=H0EV96_GLAL7|nr:hypothetical protein M7I_6691 [Glarea lozoyensis 74030]
MLIMWNPEIDYIALQGRMDRFLLPENLSRYHPEFAAETRNLIFICFTEEPPAEWARGSDTFQSAGSQRGRYWRIFRPLIIPSQDSTNAAGGSFSPEVRFSQNDDSTLQGIYQVLDRKGKTHDLSEAIAKYQVHNQEKRQILE